MRYKSRKYLDIRSLNKIANQAPEPQDPSILGQTIFFVAVMAFVVTLLVGNAGLFSQKVIAPDMTLQRTIADMRSISNFQVTDSSESTPTASEEPHTEISYTSDTKLFDVFRSELSSVIQKAQQEHNNPIDINVTGERYTFKYEGLIEDPSTELNFQSSLNILHDFAFMKNNLNTILETSRPNEVTGKRQVTIHTHTMLGNRLYGSPTLSETLNSRLGYFTSEDQFVNFDYVLITSLGEDPAIDLETKLSSMDDIMVASTMSQDTFDALLGLKINSWSAPLTEINYTAAKNAFDAKLSIVADTEQQNENFKQQMNDYWMGEPQILRPAPYLVEVKSKTRDGELIFSLRR